MDKKQVGMILFIFIILYCCYHVPYRIECPGDCQIEIDIPGEQHLILSDEERDEAILLLNQLMIRRRFTFIVIMHMNRCMMTIIHMFMSMWKVICTE